MKLLFESWRKYLNEYINVAGGQPIMGSPDATSGRNMKPLQFNDDIPKNPELNEEELEEESLKEVEPLPSPIDPVPFPDKKE